MVKPQMNSEFTSDDNPPIIYSRYGISYFLFKEYLSTPVTECYLATTVVHMN